MKSDRTDGDFCKLTFNIISQEPLPFDKKSIFLSDQESKTNKKLNASLAFRLKKYTQNNSLHSRFVNPVNKNEEIVDVEQEEDCESYFEHSIKNMRIESAVDNDRISVRETGVNTL